MTDEVKTICRKCRRLWYIDESGAVVYRNRYEVSGYAVVETCPDCAPPKKTG